MNVEQPSPPGLKPPTISTRLGAQSWLVILLLISLGIRLALAPIVMNWDDRRHFIGAAHKTLRYGLASIYETLPDYEAKRKVRLPYPPIPVYAYAAIGWTYSLFDSNFKEVGEFTQLPFDSLALSFLIKIPAFLFELILALAIFFFVRGQQGERMALVCTALYLLNPAVIYDSALWAQPDSIHSAFLALATIFLIQKRPLLCLPLLTMALLSKPQPLMAAPLIVIFLFKGSTVRQSINSVIVAAATALAVLIPFLWQNSHVIARLMETMANRDTYVSGNAHNFWWLLLSLFGIDPRIDDSSIAVAGVSYSIVSLVVVALLYTTVVTFFVKKPTVVTAEPIAYVCLLVFTFAVRMHENHGVQIIPLLLLTGLALFHQRLVLACLTIGILANMGLHSREIVGGSNEVLLSWLRIANSGLSVAILIYWSWELFRRRRTTDVTKGIALPMRAGVRA